MSGKQSKQAEARRASARRDRQRRQEAKVSGGGGPDLRREADLPGVISLVGDDADGGLAIFMLLGAVFLLTLLVIAVVNAA